jgi:hypothetical protein
VTGLSDGVPGEAIATWVAALVTLVVLGGLLGERRLFGWSQHLLAGLLTGFLAVLAIREVILPRVVEPLASDPAGRPELWVVLAVGALAAAAPWVPRAVAIIPISVAVGTLSAFALGGAVVGTIVPQVAAAIAEPSADPTATAAAVGSAAVSALVLASFLHGGRKGRIAAAMSGAGRWVLLAGLGGWLGYLVLSRLVLLLDRIAFLLRDWIGIGA